MNNLLGSLQPGTIIAGRYEVIKCLGAGSMGLVYCCRHRELTGHTVAVKVLFPEVANDDVASARFKNEIFASYRVSHQNVVRAFEFIKDGDIVAYSMEYVEGGDLSDRLNSKNPISIQDAIDYLIQMSAGVQAIHDAGIVHRDLKPENILIRRDGIIKIADFGIARTGGGPRLTEHGGVVGTIDYVAPEYLLENKVDSRSDIYALGMIAYEMVTGELPFKAPSVTMSIQLRTQKDPIHPCEIRKDLPKDIGDLILNMMMRDPSQRIQSAADIYTKLFPLAREQYKNLSSEMRIKSSSFVPFENKSDEVTVNRQKKGTEVVDRKLILSGIETDSYVQIGDVSFNPEETLINQTQFTNNIPQLDPINYIKNEKLNINSNTSESNLSKSQSKIVDWLIILIAAGFGIFGGLVVVDKLISSPVKITK